MNIHYSLTYLNLFIIIFCSAYQLEQKFLLFLFRTYGSILINFSNWTRTGVFNMIWPLARIKEIINIIWPLASKKENQHDMAVGKDKRKFQHDMS